MIKILLLLISLSAVLFSSGCKSASAQNTDSENEKTSIRAVPENTPPANKSAAQTGQSKTSAQTASFNGVSYDYNPQIFGEAVPERVAEQVLENETDKPDDIYPRHVRFTFKKQNRKSDYKIEVFPIEGFRRVWKSAGKDNAAAFEEKLSAVRKAVKDKNFRENGEIPYLPAFEGREMFVARAKNLRFRNGDGVFFLTQFIYDSGNLVNNDELILTYQGISNDKKYYVSAEFPVTVSFLPNRDATEFEGYKAPRTDEEVKTGEKKYERYVAKMTSRLEKISPDEFQPRLRYFEQIISTLKIENTENKEFADFKYAG